MMVLSGATSSSPELESPSRALSGAGKTVNRTSTAGRRPSPGINALDSQSVSVSVSANVGQKGISDDVHFRKTKWWTIQLVRVKIKRKQLAQFEFKQPCTCQESQTFLCESDALVHQAWPWVVFPYQDDPGGASANSWMLRGPAQTYSRGWASAACLAWIFGSRPNIWSTWQCRSQAILNKVTGV